VLIGKRKGESGQVSICTALKKGERKEEKDKGEKLAEVDRDTKPCIYIERHGHIYIYKRISFWIKDLARPTPG